MTMKYWPVVALLAVGAVWQVKRRNWKAAFWLALCAVAIASAD